MWVFCRIQIIESDHSLQVITSSFAAILDPKQPTRPGYVYSEKDWNPITEEEAIQNPANGYRASKTFAERASWEFIEKEKPNFSLATVSQLHPKWSEAPN